MFHRFRIHFIFGFLFRLYVSKIVFCIFVFPTFAVFNYKFFKKIDYLISNFNKNDDGVEKSKDYIQFVEFFRKKKLSHTLHKNIQSKC